MTGGKTVNYSNRGVHRVRIKEEFNDIDCDVQEVKVRANSSPILLRRAHKAVGNVVALLTDKLVIFSPSLLPTTTLQCFVVCKLVVSMPMWISTLMTSGGFQRGGGLSQISVKFVF